ncbi:hypothetical protein OPIT5_17075 [Opitutaceae bacterium TAV5]|nr:hypothetical protein OPIT5_17075 [Opitutaceae bacterium TAV5]
MKPPPALLLRLCAGFSFTLASSLFLHATTYTWTGEGDDTRWNNVENWDANGVAQSGTETGIILAKSGSYTVTQNSGAGMSFNRLVISSESGVVTIAGTNSFSTNAPTADGFAELQLNNTNTSSWSNQLTLNRTLHFTGTGTGQMTLNGVVQGTQGIVVDAAGVLALTKTNTFQGGLTVKRGTVTLTTAAAAGTGAITMEGGTLRNSTSSGVAMTELNQALNISGNFTLGYNGTQRGFTFTKAVTLTGTDALRGINLIAQNKATDLLILNGAIGDDGGNNGLKFSSTGTVRFGGAASNTYTGQTLLWGQNVNLVLQKTDGATAIARDLYIGHGTVTIETGTQRVGGKFYSTDYATSDLQINSGATLAVAGETGLATRSLTTDSTGAAGTLLLESSATLHVSDYWTDQENGFSAGQRIAAAAALTWVGSLTLDGGATLNFDLTADPSASDGIILTGDASVITFSDTTGLAPVIINLNALDGAALASGTTYTLLSVTGGFVNLDEQNLAERLTLNANGLEGTFALTANALTFTVTSAIPEPSTWVWITGAFSLLITVGLRKHLRDLHIN